MPSIINDSLNLKKKELLDSRLSPVDTYSNLPVLNTAISFIPEGATVLVRDTNKNYQAQRNPNLLTQLIWVDISPLADGLVVGEVSIAPVNPILDLSLVTPEISRCHSVLIKITSNATIGTINSIINFPLDQSITFYTEPGKTITFTHKDYDVTNVNNSIVLEDGFDFNLVGRYDANESLTLKKDKFKICQVSAVQFIKKSEIQELIIQSATVVDNLLSNSAVQSLSANQGRLLNLALQSKANTSALPAPKFTFIDNSDITRNNILSYSTNSTPIFEFTTPNDGYTRNLLIVLTCQFAIADNSVSGGYTTGIVNATTGATLSLQESLIDNTPNTNNENTRLIHVHNYLIQNVSPNTDIQIKDGASNDRTAKILKSILTVMGL